ncbi:MAG: ComEC/Rec2 family competence protein, partial [Bacteroidia bacterium]
MIVSEIIFVRLLIPLIVGILCAYNLDKLSYLYIDIAITVFIFAILTGINILYRPLRAYRLKHLTGLFFTLLVVGFGGALCLAEKHTLKPAYFGSRQHHKLKIWINDEPQLRNGIIRFTANVTTTYHNNTSIPAIGKLLVAIKTDSSKKQTYTYGDELIIDASCIPVSPPYNPGEFDFKSWLGAKNIYLQTFVLQHRTIKTQANNGLPIVKFALQLRKKQISVYEQIIQDREAFAVASTLILGYRADLSNETLSSYSKTGTIHALSVSGMHVGIIYVVLNWLLSFLDKKPRLKVVKVVIICTIIWFYSLLTGFSPSVLRSAIMLTTYILAKSLNRHTNSYNILAFTAFCLLIFNPLLIWDVGFQLSFLAVLGLIYLHPKIHKWLYFDAGWADWIWSSISLSLAAQIATFPLSIYYFHRFPIYFIISNLFILVPITVLMYLGISILLFKLLFLGPIFEWLIIFMNNGLTWIAELPFSGVNQIWIDKIQLLLLSIGLIYGVIGLSDYKKRYVFISIVSLFIFQASIGLDKISRQIQKKIIFFSLNKGYCVAFISADKAFIVTDLVHSD